MDDHRLVAPGQDGVGAERLVAVGFAEGEAVAAHEPLAVLVHEGDERDGHLEKPRGQGREPVERGVGRRVEHLVARERAQAFVLVGRQGCGHGRGLAKAGSRPAGPSGNTPINGVLRREKRFGCTPREASARKPGWNNSLGGCLILPYKERVPPERIPA